MSDVNETTRPKWILYQIGGDEPNVYRFVITPGFQDDAVTAQLRKGEFIDTTTTLLGELGGDVTVIDNEKLQLLAALRAVYHAMLSYKFGNASPDLSDEISKVAQAAIKAAEGSGA
jgi:hypothetical protein